MKILIAITDSFSANFIKGQASYLAKHGHTVTIVSGPGVEIDNLEKFEPVKIVRIPFAREISIFKDILSLFTVIRLINREKPDIINAGNPKTGFIFSVAHIFFWRTPLIFTLRGLRSDTLKGFKKKVVKFTERISCRLSNKVIAISPSLKEHAVKVGIVSERKCMVLSKGSSNGVDTSYYTLQQEVKKKALSIRDQYHIPKEVFKLIFVGRITKDKGIVELLDAWEMCLQQHADIHLVIAGPIEKQDPIPEHYYDLIKKHKSIHYLNKQVDVRPVYALGDALVLYSHREGFGNVVIEAASMGLPTIVADIPGLKDTTEHEVTGLIVEGRNPHALSSAILKLYNNRPELTKKYGDFGRRRVEKYFSNEVVWQKQLELYQNLSS